MYCKHWPILKLMQAVNLRKKIRFGIRRHLCDDFFCILSILRRMIMDSLITTGTACLSKFRTIFLHLRSLLYAPSLLTPNSLKSVIVLMHWIHYLRTGFPCCIPRMAFPSIMSQRYDVKNGKQMIRRSYPVLPQQLSWQIFSILDKIADMALCSTTSFSTFSSVKTSQESSPAQQLQQTKSSRIRTLPSQQICYYHLAVPLHIQPEKNAAKMYPLCTTHRLYSSLKLSKTAWTG